MVKKDKPLAEEEVEKAFIKGLSLTGGESGYPCRVDVRNGKVIRIRPLHYDWKYDKSQFDPWKMEARGQVFEPRLKALPSPFGLTYKQRIYSRNRILYTLKRVDWNPVGDISVANRGKSKFVRISWDEALDIIVSELKRVKEMYGPEAVLSQADVHREGKAIHASHGSANRLLSLLGGYIIQMTNPDSWEGWVWGAKHACGMEEVGQGLTPSYRTIYSLVKERRAFVVDYIM